MPDPADDISFGRAVTGAAKRVVPWVLLALVGLLVWSLYGQYQRNTAADHATTSRPAASLIATPAPAKPRSAPATSPAAAVVRIEALASLNFHREASASSDSYRTLQKGERVILLGTSGSWYKVKDAGGTIGYVTTSPQYTKVVRGG